jgi:hypothetical protein
LTRCVLTSTFILLTSDEYTSTKLQRRNANAPGIDTINGTQLDVQLWRLFCAF